MDTNYSEPVQVVPENNKIVGFSTSLIGKNKDHLRRLYYYVLPAVFGFSLVLSLSFKFRYMLNWFITFSIFIAFFTILGTISLILYKMLLNKVIDIDSELK